MDQNWTDIQTKTWCTDYIQYGTIMKNLWLVSEPI